MLGWRAGTSPFTQVKSHKPTLSCCRLQSLRLDQTLPQFNKQTAGSSGRKTSGNDPLLPLPPNISSNGINLVPLDVSFPWPPGLCTSSHQASFPIHPVSDAATGTVTRYRAVSKPISKSVYPVQAREAYLLRFILFAPIFSY